MSNYGTLIDNQLPAPRAVRIGGSVVCNHTYAQEGGV